jgi:sec-independent protein translocase protein TatA
MIFANIFGFGNPLELGIIAGVVVLLFGGNKIAGFGRSLGEGLKEFKKATQEEPEKHEVPSTAPKADESTTKVD